MHHKRAAFRGSTTLFAVYSAANPYSHRNHVTFANSHGYRFTNRDANTHHYVNGLTDGHNNANCYPNRNGDIYANTNSNSNTDG